MDSRDRFIQGKTLTHLHIGDLLVSSGQTVVHTVLGSCVSVCLYDRRIRLAGINHILLPGTADLAHGNDSARYGVNAMEKLINGMLSQGAKKNCLEAKIFGGGHVIGPRDTTMISPGQKNISFVLEFLDLERIQVVGRDTGGYCTRKLYFHMDTFEVFLKRIESDAMMDVVAEEKRYGDRLRQEISRPADITLFE